MNTQSEILNAVEQLQQGNLKYFDQLYKNTAQYVHARCRIASQTEEEALDLMQEVYIAVYKNIKSLRNPSSFYPWLKAIIIRQGAKMAGKYGNETVVSEFNDGIFENIEDEVPGAEAEMIKREDAEAVKQCIAALPPDQRLVILAYYYEEMKVEDIAACAGISAGTVKSRLYTARKKLKESIILMEKKRGIRLYSVSVPTTILALKMLLAEPFITDTKSEEVFEAICKSLNISSVYYSENPSADKTASCNGSDPIDMAAAGAKRAGRFIGHTAMSTCKKWLLPVIIGFCSGVAGVTGIYFAIRPTNDTENPMPEIQTEAAEVAEITEAAEVTEITEAIQTNAVPSTELQTPAPTVQEESAAAFDPSVYDPVLEDYSEYDYYGFCDHEYASYILTNDMFTTAWQPYLGRAIYYTFYDFFDDGLPELLLSAYFEESDSYAILDIYGTDGETPISLIDEEAADTIELFMCENGVIKSYSTSGGGSSSSTMYFRMENGGTSAVLIDDAYHDGYGVCYHMPPENIEAQQSLELILSDEYTISRQEYDSIIASYPEDEEAKQEYEWKSVAGFYDPSAGKTVENPSAETAKAWADEYYGSFLEYFKNSEANGFAGAPLELMNSVFWDETVFPGGYSASDSELYYTVLDLMGDGAPELFISDGSSIYGYYITYGDLYRDREFYNESDKYQVIPVHIMDGWGKEYSAAICENGCVRVVHYMGTHFTVSYHYADETSERKTRAMRCTNGKYFTGMVDHEFNWLADTATEVSEEEFNAFCEKYPLKTDIKWYKLSDYGI